MELQLNTLDLLNSDPGPQQQRWKGGRVHAIKAFVFCTYQKKEKFDTKEDLSSFYIKKS